MSPVLPKSAYGVPGRRRPAQQTALFPIHSPEQAAETDPKARTGSDLAPIVPGPGGSISGCPSPDCPPALPEDHGAPRHGESRTRDAAARCGAEESARFSADAPAPLVGIARLAANSPVAETHRQSAERPEYFLLPVRSILNRRSIHTGDASLRANTATRGTRTSTWSWTAQISRKRFL